MNISLTPELEQLGSDKVNSGAFPSADEVIRASLRLLREQDAIYQMRLADLKREIDKGAAQIERGEVTRYASGKEAMEAIETAARARMAQQSKVKA